MTNVYISWESIKISIISLLNFGKSKIFKNKWAYFYLAIIFDTFTL